MTDGTHVGKTLVFCFDGTGNEPSDVGEFKEDESVSNILKLHVLMGGGMKADSPLIDTPSGGKQKSYYYNGIGTRESGVNIPLLGWLCSVAKKSVNKVIAPSFSDASEILNEAKQDFRNAQYQAGDKLVVFGYSRGAALARKFANMIFAERQDVRVSFLGAFDTVAAMDGIHRQGEKIKSDVLFENGTLNERIDRAVHLVSIDEDRVSFMPTLMNKDKNAPERILEVWFPGVHGDIGGGCWFDGLSDLALAFMIDRCQKALGDHISITDGGDTTSLEKLLRRRDDAWVGLEVDDIAIHPRVDGLLHGYTGIIMDQEPRFIRVNDNDRPSRNEDDLPLLHHSVKKRFHAVPTYRPAALRGLKFRLLLADGGHSGPILGISGLREWSNTD